MKKTILIIGTVIIIAAASAFAGYSYVNDKAEKYYIFDPGDYFVTNIKESKSLLKTDVVIKMKDNKMYTYFTGNNYRIRDEIISILSSKTLTDLKREDSQSILKSELKDRLNQVFATEAIVETYFNEFVIQ